MTYNDNFQIISNLNIVKTLPYKVSNKQVFRFLAIESCMKSGTSTPLHGTSQNLNKTLPEFPPIYIVRRFLGN